MPRFSKFHAVWVVGLFLLQQPNVGAQTQIELQRKAGSVRQEIVEILGLKFKRPVRVGIQTSEDFGKYLDANLEKQMSKNLVEHFDKIVRKLGLYRGPEIKDAISTIKFVAQSQAAAYYDPASDTFYLLMQDLPEQLLCEFLTHELYHGLQDQYFDLDLYLLSQVDRLNDDELLARQAVVEGEATYIQTLWSLEHNLGTAPDPAILQRVIHQVAQMDLKSLFELIKSSPVFQGDIKKAIQAIDELPPFMIEQFLGAYLKGMGFIFEIQKQGWGKIEELYTTYPPASTEQILHPEKWLMRETPDAFEWPLFENETLFSGWEILDVDTIGEIMWRIIFAEHGMAAVGKGASAGWDGDLYAVLKKKDADDLLLLLYTGWDTEADAREFANAYRNLLKVKYADGTEHLRVERIDKDVLIIEGGEEGSANDLLDFMRRARDGEVTVIKTSDFDGDRTVGFADFIQFVQNFGKRLEDPDFDTTYDLNDDGVVNFPDFIQFAQNFGKTVGSSKPGEGNE